MRFMATWEVTSIIETDNYDDARSTADMRGFGLRNMNRESRRISLVELDDAPPSGGREIKTGAKKVGGS